MPPWLVSLRDAGEVTAVTRPSVRRFRCTWDGTERVGCGRVP
jgi:hypothetical protein